MDSLEIPFSIKLVNPEALDFWYGPWASLEEAKTIVKEEIRTLGLTVFITGLGKYCWKNGTTDNDLIPDVPEAPTLSALVDSDNKTNGNIDFTGGFKPVNVANPTDSGDAVNKEYADLKESNAKSYSDSLLTNAIKWVGYWDISAGAFPTLGIAGGSIKGGNMYDISVAGSIGTEDFEIGDTIRALVDNPGQTTTNWAKGQVNSQQASETNIGIAKVATAAQAIAKLSDTEMMTPAKSGALIAEEKKYVNYQIAMTGENEQAFFMENAGQVYDVKFAGCNSIKLKLEDSGTYPIGVQTYPFTYPANSRVFFTFNYNDLLKSKCSIKLKCKDN